MTVLTMIGILAFYIFVVFLMIKINRYTNLKKRKEFFSAGYLFVYFIAFALAYYGYEWYEKAVKLNGDILNGILIIIFAAIIFILVIIKNIKSSNFIFGITISIVQVIIYMPILVWTTFGGFVALFCILVTFPYIL